jgi:phosphohistidine phosphatase
MVICSRVTLVIVPTLVLIRHSKTEPHRDDDRSRRLTERGRGDAERVRRWLTDRGVVPDRVVVSTSARTRETWELAGVGSAAPEYDDRVYEASVRDLRDVVEETADDVGTLVLVGHNPSVEQLAWELDDSDEARDRTNRGMRTSGIAVFELDAWGDTHGRLTDFEA